MPWRTGLVDDHQLLGQQARMLADEADVTWVPRNDYIQRADRTINACGFVIADLFAM